MIANALRAAALASTAASAACGPPAATRDDAPPPEPARLEYAPFRASYLVISHGTDRQEPPGGEPLVEATEEQYYLSVAVTHSGDGLQARLMVDSVRVLRGSELAPLRTEADAAAGTTFTAALTPRGELTDLTGGDQANSLLRLLASRLRQFFLRLPAGGVAPGTMWSDTSTLESVTAGIGYAVESVHRHEAVEWEDYAGTRGLRVRTDSRYSVSGEGSQGGQAIVIEGAGRRHAERLLDAAGRYLSVTAADTTELTATVTGPGLTVPILQIRYDTLRLLP
jgi:hypothetical protein